VKDPTHIYTSTGPFNVSLTVTSNNGCINSTSKNFTKVFAEPKADFSTVADVCLGTAITLTDNSQSPGSTITEWRWDYNNDGTVDEIKTNGAPFTYTFTTAGTYQVKLTIKSAAGCESVSTTNVAIKTVNVNSVPTAAFTAVAPFCRNSAVTFSDQSVANSGVITQWTWNYGEGAPVIQAPTNGTVTHTYATINSYTVTLQVRTDKGCSSAVATQTIDIRPLPTAGFVVPELCVTDANTPFTDTSSYPQGSIVAWDWNFGDINATPGNPNTSTSQSPSHQFVMAGTYTVTQTVTNNDGCKASKPLTVAVNGGVITPRYTITNSGALCSNQSITLKESTYKNKPFI
ncbi:MAG: PKD domain-containing protein, partial [Cytophagaceae bacterium]